ncbi:MAG: RIP metalloprotease RseP [Clostridiales bacterium]|nr:RIP metalloprotease RseP [Clostridiales bacterium]
MSIWSILVVILMLGLLVTIHELGHFIVARLLKIKAFEVSIFVGPKLFSWRKKDVDWSIRALPFGAYVRFSDFDEEGNVIQSDDPDLLVNQKRWKRLLVALAGPFMNAVLGIILFLALFCINGYATLDAAPTLEDSQLYNAVLELDGEIRGPGENTFCSGDTITHINGSRVFTYLDFYYEMENGVSPVKEMDVRFISSKTGDSYTLKLVPELTQKAMIGITHYGDTDNKYNGWEVASVYDEQNGGHPVLKPGDFLVRIDGISVSDEEAISKHCQELKDGEMMTLEYVRNGEERKDDCVVSTITVTNDRGLRVIYNDVDSVSHFFGALKTAALMPLTVCNVSIKAIGDVFEGEEEVYNMVSGPVGVTSVVSDVVDNVDSTFFVKFLSVLQLSAIISIGLMFTNMLPIPGLDGVQVILIIVEMIIGRPLSKKAENVINIVGFVLLLALVTFAFASDIIRIVLGG